MTGFGPFEIDSVRGELRRKGVVVPLPAQPFRVLCLLVAQPGELVTREELRSAVWPEGTFVDFDRGLNFCISRLRRALDDDARRPAYVETLPGRGYRFIAAVSGGADTITPEAPSPAAVPVPRPRRAAVVASAAALALALLALSSGPPPPGGEAARPPADGAARTAYVRGLYQARVAVQGPASLASFREAAHLDPGNAAVQSALAEAWMTEVAEGRVPAGLGMPLAREAAARAAASAEDARALLVMGTVAFRYDWDWDGAERLLRRSIAADATLASAHLELADLLLVRGQADAAVREARRAEEIDPVCPSVSGRVAASYYAARRFGEAAAAWRQSAGVAANAIGAHEKLFHAYRHANRPQEALREAEKVMGLVGVRPGPRFFAPERSAHEMQAFVTGTIDYLQGDAARRPALFADRMAVLHAAAGARGEALRWLELAAREHALSLPVTLATDPDLDPLRGEAAFRDLMRRLQLG
jgi:DNA-binding winged helix-turn-helix (wHTH) protein